MPPPSEPTPSARVAAIHRSTEAIDDTIQALGAAAEATHGLVELCEGAPALAAWIVGRRRAAGLDATAALAAVAAAIEALEVRESAP